eukprot:5451394-Prymnesium_polylepis.1
MAGNRRWAGGMHRLQEVLRRKHATNQSLLHDPLPSGNRLWRNSEQRFTNALLPDAPWSELRVDHRVKPAVAFRGTQLSGGLHPLQQSVELCIGDRGLGLGVHEFDDILREREKTARELTQDLYATSLLHRFT